MKIKDDNTFVKGEVFVQKDINSRMIQELNDEIEKINIDDVEVMLKENTDISLLEKMVWNQINVVNKYINRLKTINYNIINKDVINKQISEVISMNDIICNVEYMDAPLNNINHIVQAFYREIIEKYDNMSIQMTMFEITNVYNGKRLKLHNLSKDEQLKAYAINMYLKIYITKIQMDRLLDCICYISSVYN